MCGLRQFALAAICSAALAPAAWAAQNQPGTTPKSEPSAPSLTIPNRQIWLGTVRLPVAVLADGQRLAAGTYRVRLTGEHASGDVVGQSGQLERWVEFVQGNQVKGRALAPVVPAADAHAVADGPLPRAGTVRIQRLKGDDYFRLWFNYKGDQVMVYLPEETHAHA